MLRVSIILFFVLSMTAYKSFAQSSNGTIPPTDKLLVIGDSLTSGLYATHEQATFVSILGNETGLKIGRRNASTLPIAAGVWSEVKPWSPSIVVIEIGLNDVSKGKLTVTEWKVMYQTLIADIKTTGAKLIICTMFDGISDNHPDYRKYLDYNQMIRDLAAENSVTLADLWKETENCDNCISTTDQLSYFAPHYHGDNFHPSDNGHRVIANTILEAMNYQIPKKTFFPFLVG